MADSEKFEQLNKDVSEWAKRQAQQMRRLVATLTLKEKHAIRRQSLRIGYKYAVQDREAKDYKPLTKSISASVRKDFGEPKWINFHFAKQGIFLEHGVGRGRPRGSSKARPRPWIAPILDRTTSELADLVGKNYADFIVGEIEFSIPGILKRTIKTNNG